MYIFQVPIRPAICTPPTTPNEHQNPRKVNLKTGFITIPTENASNSSCDKDISPPASPQTASSLFVNKSSVGGNMELLLAQYNKMFQRQVK